MSQNRHFVTWTIAILAVLGLGGAATQAFVGELNSAQLWRRWHLNPTDSRVPTTSVNRASRSIVYRLDQAGSHRSQAERELDAIRTAFDLWQGVSGTALKFEETASVLGMSDINSSDGFNTIFWTTNLFINGGRDNLSGVLALTYVASFADGNVIFDSDTVFNAVQFRWSTDGLSTQTQDPFVEAIALHEIGHMLGLRHSPVGGATMLFVGDQGVNSQVGLSEDERTAARALYGTSDTANLAGRITGTVRVSGTAVLGAAVFAEDASGSVVAGTVTRSNGVYELPGLFAGTYSIRVSPLDTSFGANYLIRGADIAPAYRNSATEFRASDTKSVTVTSKGTSVADFELLPGAPLRIARLLRPAAELSAPSYNNKPVAIPADGQLRYVGVLTTALPSEAAPFRLSLSGAGVTHGAVEVRPNALGTMTLVAVPVRLETDAAPGLRSLRLERGSESAWAHGFVEVPPQVPDVNADGLDDRFQRRYWSRFTSAGAAPVADPDLDRFSNRWEFERGSDPTNRLSAHFEILSVQVTGAGARVSAETAAGGRFQLWRREQVEGSAWTAVGAEITASGAVTEFLDVSATQRVEFYRVRLAVE